MAYFLDVSDYVKEKINKMIDAFSKLENKKCEMKGQKLNRHYFEIEEDIDADYKLVLVWGMKWKLVYKESKAELIEVEDIYALPELIGKFTEAVMEDYYMEKM